MASPRRKGGKTPFYEPRVTRQFLRPPNVKQKKKSVTAAGADSGGREGGDIIAVRVKGGGPLLEVTACPSAAVLEDSRVLGGEAVPSVTGKRDFPPKKVVSGQ